MPRGKGKKKTKRKDGETVSDNTNRVRRLSKAYEAAQREWEEFYEEHEEIFNHAKKLSYELNQAADELKRGIRETGISAGPMTYTEQSRRIFDGQRLFEMLVGEEREDLRDELITVEYKIDQAAFDRAVQTGQITPGEANKVVKEFKVTPMVLHAPKAINLEP